MIILDGDLLKTPFQIIAHQVNCHGVMDGGVALQIKNKYPDVYNEYRELCCKKCSADLLGTAQIVKCLKATEYKIFFNIFGQGGYGSDKVQTDYDALCNGFIDAISKFRDMCDVPRYINVVIAIPYKIGCGLAGGDWKKVKGILESLEKTENATFVAYKYEG